MIKNCIITPTFPGHFPCIELYLKSYEKYVEDKAEVPIFFTIEKIDKEKFAGIVKPFSKTIDIHVIYFDDLLKENSIYLTPTNLLRKYDKFSYQTLKKFYSILKIDAERFLVLDSESMWIRNTNMTECFDNYFADPHLYYSVIVVAHAICHKLAQDLCQNLLATSVRAAKNGRHRNT